MSNHRSHKEVYVDPTKKKQLVRGNNVHLPLYDWQLSESDLRRARAELGETDEKIKMSLQALKERLSRDKKVRYRTDDSYLLRFLRFRKYDIERTYQNIRKFYELRRKSPEFFVIPENFKAILDRNIVDFYPYRDEEGTLLMGWNIENWDLNVTSCKEMINVVACALEIITTNPKMQVYGVIGVWDVKGFTSRHMTEILKNDPISFLTFVENCIPWRIKRCLIINTTRPARLLFSLARPFLTKKIKERVLLLGSDENEWFQYVNPALLPKRVGGKLDQEEVNLTQIIVDNLPYLRYERSFC